MKEKKDIVNEKKFSKDSLMNSRKYSSKKILLKVLLKDEEMYSMKETDLIVEKYLKGEVK